MNVNVNGREILTDDKLLKFFVTDPLEEYRVKTILTKEPETIQWIDSWTSSTEPLRFWDIGSNIGIYTLYAAVKNQNLHVVSIEPFFKNFVRLKANIHLNKLWNIAPLCIALSNNSGWTDFCVTDERYGASGNIVTSDAHHKTKERLLQVCGDDLLKLNIEPPNFLKIDVDGIERDIIEGMKNILQNKALKSILIEINSKEDFVSINEIFSNFGFSPDDNFNKLENHSRNRRSQDPKNNAENWIFARE